MKTRAVIVNIENQSGLLSHPERFCSPDRLARLNEIHNAEKRIQSAACEFALSYAMYGEKLVPPVYSWLENGKPAVEKGFISLSHTNGAAAAAYSDMPIGIDIEFVRPVSPAVKKRILAPAEICLTDAQILSRFTMKEAYLKLTGEGVFGGMRSIYETEGRLFRGGVFKAFVSHFDSAGHACCIVSEASPESIELIRL